MDGSQSQLKLDLILTSNVRGILSQLSAKKLKAFIVGGAVRDALFEDFQKVRKERIIPGKYQKGIRDFDILVNGSLQEIESVFSGSGAMDNAVKTAGKAFPVCIVNGVEIASARNVNSDIPFPQSDLEHRDFTINAMAWEPETGKVIDPFNGYEDLKNRLICFTGDAEQRINEDPLRIVRACRFVAMIKGRIEQSSLQRMKALRGLLNDVARERILVEILKAMELDKPSLFFNAMRQAGILGSILPSLDRCYELDGGPHHGETVFEHCMLVGDALPAFMPVLRLAGFLHDTGKFDAAKIEDGRLTFRGHEKFTQAVEKDLEKLRISTRKKDYILSVISAHMRPLTDQTTPKAARRLLAMLEEKDLDYKDFMRIRIADKKGNLKKSPYTIGQLKQRLKILLKELKSDQALKMNQLAISGDDIIRIMGISPGPEVGKIKRFLFEKVLDNPLLNTEKELMDICLSLKIKK